MRRISVFARRQRIKKLENWTMYAIFAEAFFLAIFPSVISVVVFVGIAAWFLRLQVDNKFKLRSLPFDVPIAIFVMLGAISVFTSPASSFSLIYNYCALIGVFGATYLLVGQNIRTPEQAKLMIKGLAASTLIVVLVGYFQYIFGIDVADIKWIDAETFPEMRKRVFSTMENPNVLAGYLDVMICLALGVFAKVTDRRQKSLLIVAIIMMAACLAMTYSRGAFLAIAIVFMVYGILQDWRILILFAAITGLLLYNDKAFLDRILSVLTITTDSVEGLRIGIWVSTISMIADHPFTGIGWGAYKFIYPQYNYYLADPSIIIYHAHNLYLNVAAEVGIAGALAYFWYFFGTMFMALSLNSNKRYRDIKNSALTTQSKFREQLDKLIATNKFLQKLERINAMLMAQMADLSEKFMNWLSFKSSKNDKAPDKSKTKKSEPELVHHEEMKWDKKSTKKSDDDDDKMDMQRFNDDDEDDVETLPPDVQLAEGVRFGIGLAFLSMALNGMANDLLFNVPSSILMWQLGALSAAINLLDEN